MLEKQMIKFILSKWNYGNFRIVFWDQEEFHVGNQSAKFSLIFK
ncbi:TPA: SAM-dependent methyltransferase, partial [Campylobacter jejuni]|nr:SAM-dependent methyltransferase [Campylobacter jejuni]